MKDMIHHPDHYTQAGVMLEPIDVLRFAPFDLGNCLKYILRAGHKNNKLEDLEKAERYLEWAMESNLRNPEPYNTFLNHYGSLLVKFEAFKELQQTWSFWKFANGLAKIIEMKKGEE